MKSLGQEALEAGLCSEHVCFEFDSAETAKTAWERCARVRFLSINRVAVPAGPFARTPEAIEEAMKNAKILVIAAGENAALVAGAEKILADAGGRKIPSPLGVLEATAAKRARLHASGHQRAKVRHPDSGSLMDTEGNVLPVRRPQG